MYSQVQVPILIHGDTIECVASLSLLFCLTTLEKNYFMDNNAQITEIGSCIMYLTNSDTDTRNWCCLSVGIG